MSLLNINTSVPNAPPILESVTQSTSSFKDASKAHNAAMQKANVLTKKMTNLKHKLSSIIKDHWTVQILFKVISLLFG
jgi:hypothetical protein